MRRHRARVAAVVVAVALVLVAGPAGAAEAPSDAELAASVSDLELSVLDVDLDEAVVDLEQEEETAGGGTTVTVSSDVLFAFDSARPSRSATRTAERLADRAEGRVRVTGFTDAKGSDAYNRRLSTQRARAVEELLVDAGVSAGDVTARGRGEADPVAANEENGKDSPAGRAKNRRVEIRFGG